MDTLDLDDLHPDPMEQFRRWLADAEQRSGMSFANAMVLSTVDASGCPNSRVVLLKAVEADGFGFFTNSDSVKGRELEAHPLAALNFYWDALRRQVRARGRVSRIAAAESDDYFRSRPRLAQLGAWASLQSRELATREELMLRLADFDARYAGVEVPRPEHWNGYRLEPQAVEFWQEREGRLHDRLVYRRDPAGWKTHRLYP